MALLVSFIGGVLPLLIIRRVLAASIIGVNQTLLWWLIFYTVCPSLVWPLAGVVVMAVTLNVLFDFCFCCAMADSSSDYYKDYAMIRWPTLGVFLAAIALTFVVGLSGWGAFRADEYRALIGEVKKFEFTKDMQPSDPAHIRLVPPALAEFLADKQLGEAKASIGSQYKVAKEYMTLQRVRGELWYVAPLDYNGFSVWTSIGNVTGYVKVSAEDPYKKVELFLGESFVYTPGAYFSDNLERLLWTNGYLAKGLTDYTFEEDESGKCWWVVSVFEPTISYWGKKITGVAVIDPTSGEITFHEKDKIPDWIDSAIPKSFAVNYIKEWGNFPHGWLNSWWGKKELVDVTSFGSDPDYLEIVYGADGEPYWFTGITSATTADAALVSVMYIHSRTGEAKEYKIAGMNGEAVLQVINNEIQFKGWKGTAPMLFNFYGRPIWVSTVLGQSNTFKGVALVDALTQELYWDGDNPMASFTRLRAEFGHEQIAVPLSEKGARTTFQGKIERVAKDGANYYLLVSDLPHALIGTAGISLELVFTQPGDEVKGEYVDSGEDIFPLVSFDNLAVTLELSAKQLKERDKMKEEALPREGRGVEVIE